MYMGRRQPHKSRLGRALKRGQGRGEPGPGSYKVENIRVKSPRVHNQPFGKAKRFRDDQNSSLDVAHLASGANQKVPELRPALGVQVLSTLSTRPVVSFGRGSRSAASISCTRTGRMGIDSPGPIYHPQIPSRELESRFGVRPTFSPRARVSKLIDRASELAGSRRRPKKKRPSTSSSSQLSKTEVGKRILSEREKDIGYGRPGTSFGRARRPPLYALGSLSIPGPRYEVNQRFQSTRKRATTPHFGSSTRDQRRKTRGVVDERPRGSDGAPGPASYFPRGDASVQLAEKRTTSGFGPAFTMASRTRKKRSPRYTTELNSELDGLSIMSGLSITSMGKQIEGVRKTAPSPAFTVAPRFGPVAGFI